MISRSDAEGAAGNAAPASARTVDGEPRRSRKPGMDVAFPLCDPKIRALASLATLPPPEPLASVTYASRGNTLVIGGDERAVGAAVQLAASLPVTLLLTSRPSAQSAVLAGVDLEGTTFPIWAGKVSSLQGYLGNFTVSSPTWPLSVMPSRECASRGRRCGLRRCRRFFRSAALRPPPPPQGYWRVSDAGIARARPGRGAGRGRGIREAALLRLPREPLRALPLGHRRVQQTASTSARPKRSAPTVTTSRSTRTCAWGAAPVPPCAPPARWASSFPGSRTAARR